MAFTALEGDMLPVLRVSITRHYGPMSVTLGADVECDISSAADRQRSYDEITDTLIAEHRRQADRLRAMGMGSGKPASGELGAPAGRSSNQETTDTTDIFEVESIDVEVKNGKRYYKVRGGRWKKHGVRIWPDDENVIAGAPVIDWHHLPVKVVPVDEPMRAVVSMAGGKPVKVLQLIAEDVEF